jgi:hypothetical protein
MPEVPLERRARERKPAPQSERLKRQERSDASGHGMQTPPGRQRDIAESSEEPEATARVDPETLDELKGEDDEQKLT